jgi:pimeloyl-ACP methyl ester carboxylesterase
VSNRPDNYPAVSSYWAEIAQKRPVSLPNTLRQLFAASRFKTDGFIPKIPILFLASTHDRMVDVSCSKAIAKAWNKSIVEHPEGGHDLTTDDPTWVAKEINRWLENAPL